MTGKLAGIRILVPESRELDLFAGMLESHGAVTIRCPLVAILDLADPAPVEAWLRRLIAGGQDDLILLTGEGLRRMLAIADHAGLQAETVAVIGRLRTIIRGPKPARALREIGLTPDLTAQRPTTEGVIETLSAFDLKGRRVGVQLYPGNPNDLLLDFLTGAGARARSGAALSLCCRMRKAGRLEAAIPANGGRRDRPGRLHQFAADSAVVRSRGRPAYRGGAGGLSLARTKIAAVGPVVAAAVERIGAKVDLLPDASFHLKPLVNAIVTAFNPAA